MTLALPHVDLTVRRAARAEEAPRLRACSAVLDSSIDGRVHVRTIATAERLLDRRWLRRGETVCLYVREADGGLRLERTRTRRSDRRRAA